MKGQCERRQETSCLGTKCLLLGGLECRKPARRHITETVQRKMHNHERQRYGWRSLPVDGILNVSQSKLDEKADEQAET